MDVEFDPAKDAANIAKHGASLGRAIELVDAVAVEDHRFPKHRLRIYGLLDACHIVRR